MPETPNHGYNVPTEGEQDWHEPLNENFAQYDTDIEVRDEEANLGNYDPTAGAKFLATDTETVYLGDGSAWNELETTGSTPTLDQLNPDGDFVGVGRSSAITGNEFFGVRADVDTDVFGGMYVETTDPDGWPFYGYASDGDQRAWHYFYPEENEWALDFDDGMFEALVVDSDGNLTAKGNKNFVQSVDTDEGEKEVVYTAAEAGTPHTEVSGVDTLEDGRAEIVLPAHFGWVTSDEEPLVVQTTPYGGRAGLKVVERSTDHLIVEDLEGEGDYEFAYTVRGTREGQEEKVVVREPSAKATESAPSAPADD